MENINFRIIITKQAPNPKFAEQQENIARHGNRYDTDFIPKEISNEVLITEITEEQFKVVQAEILKVFK